MGVEYKLRFACPDPASVAALLRRLPGVRELPHPDGGVELRVATADGAMPDAAARVEPGGIYFCDNGGAGREILGLLVARLVGEFGAVTVDETE